MSVSNWCVTITYSGIIEIKSMDDRDFTGDEPTTQEQMAPYWCVQWYNKHPHCLLHLNDVLDTACQKVDETYRYKGIKAVVDEYLTHNKTSEIIEQMSDEDAITFIKNENAYSCFNIITDFIDGINADDVAKFNKYHQFICKSGDLPFIFIVLKEIGSAAGWNGEFFEIPLDWTYKQLMVLSEAQLFSITRYLAKRG